MRVRTFATHIWRCEGGTEGEGGAIREETLVALGSRECEALVTLLGKLR
jgi:hypothetical protein